MSDKDDDSDLDAALAELSALRKPGDGDVDPETKALLARSDVQEAMAERQRIAEMPDPPAPEPVEVAGDGPLLVQAEAAVTYVAPVEVTAPIAPRMPSGPVRIKTDVDPRRAKTAPALRVQAGMPASVEAGEEAAAVVTLPREEAAVVPVLSRRAPSRVPSSRPANERRGLGVVIGAAIVFVAGAVTMLASLRSPGRDGHNDVSMGEGAGRAAPGSSGETSTRSGAATSPGAPTGSSVAAMETSVAAAGGGAPSVTATKSGGARSATTTEDPYADASALPPSATLQAPVVAATTSSPAPPSTSSDAAPVGTTTAAAGAATGTKPSSDRWFQKEP